jgi:hypothetical protein
MKVELVLDNDGKIGLLVMSENDTERIALDAWSKLYWTDPASTMAYLLIRPVAAIAAKEHREYDN